MKLFYSILLLSIADFLQVAFSFSFPNLPRVQPYSREVRVSLSPKDVEHLGTADQVLLTQKLVRQKIVNPQRMASAFFACQSILWKFDSAYERYVGLIQRRLVTQPTDIEVEKFEDGTGFFPSVAAMEGEAHFRQMNEKTLEEINLFKAQILALEPDARFILENSVLTFKLPNIYEFDFGPHHLGVNVARLRRISLEEKREIIAKQYAFYLDEPFFGRNHNISSYTEEDLDQLNSHKIFDFVDVSSLQQVEIEKLEKNNLIFLHEGESFEADIVTHIKDQGFIIISLGDRTYSISKHNQGNEVNYVMHTAEDVTSLVKSLYSPKCNRFKSLFGKRCSQDVIRYPLLEGRNKRIILPQLLFLYDLADIPATSKSFDFVKFLQRNREQLTEIELQPIFENDLQDDDNPQEIILIAKTQDGEQSDLTLPVEEIHRDWDGSILSIRVRNEEIHVTYKISYNSLVLGNGQAFIGALVNKSGSLPQLVIQANKR